MKTIKTLALAALAALALLTSCKKEEVCTVYYNANVYTADAALPEASAFVVKGDKIAFVGSDEDALALASEKAAKVDLEGKRVLPGMCDTHCHYFAMSLAGSGKPSLHLEEKESHEQTLARIREFVEANPDIPVIQGNGWGWNCNILASELDKIESSRPVLLMACDGHTGWCNSALMKSLGVDKNFKDIAPGASYFERDAEGNPNGRIVETAQCYWTAQALGARDENDVKTGMPKVAALYNSLGVTSIYDAGPLMVADSVALKAAQMVPDNTLRIFASIYYNGTETDEDFIARAKMLRERYTTDLVRPNTFKAFKDGTIEVATAYMSEGRQFTNPPYRRAGRGICLFPTEQLLRITQKVAAEGFNIHIHAIGDQAIDEVLDVMEGLGDIQGTKTIAHCQVLNEKTLPKFTANKDVFYQTTPVWLAQDPNFIKSFGPEVFKKYDMPVKSILDGGVTLTFGSDGPASKGDYGMNPMNNIWACVNQGKDPSLNDRPEQCLTVAQCVDAYTINAARQFGAESEIGSITAGKGADFVVLDRDIFTIDTAEIKDAKVEQTYLLGKCVYSRK